MVGVVSVQINASAKKDGKELIVLSLCVLNNAQTVNCALAPTIVRAFQDITVKVVSRLRAFRLVRMAVIALLPIPALALTVGSIRIVQHPFASRHVAMVETVLLQTNALAQQIGQD